ncbi:hypothetical protein LEP1GSC125_2380 [Leptospira mayottensis 200901122]|uniref:Uncharacterized protein n=1 Tax=Leptospira mayottensis 200901122 TaxID=1193010 RepID=A0AA87SWA7_9LEPT|nr:hypothetical protein LEP1GSC125_2380 [Leptospira mayottensis 200901122]
MIHFRLSQGVKDHVAQRLENHDHAISRSVDVVSFNSSFRFIWNLLNSE